MTTLLHVSLRAEEDKYIFEHLPTSNHWINAIYQDRDGFIWVSARSGLYRYYGDGPDDFEVICEGQMFYDISQDEDGLMWLRCSDGLITYDPVTCRLADRQEVASELGAVSRINAFEISHDNEFWWIEGNDIYVLDDTGKKHAGTVDYTIQDICLKDNIAYVLTYPGHIHRFTIDPDGQIRELPMLKITDEEVDYEHGFQNLMIDSSQNIWISQGSYGVWLYRTSSNTVLHLRHDSSDNSIQSSFINSIIEDNEGNIWLASDHGGISICDRSGKVLSRLVNRPMDDNSLSSNGVYSLYCDREGNVWVGYSKTGMSVYRGENKVWSMLHLKSFLDRNLQDDINSTCQDAEGNLWFGTDGYGIVKSDLRTGKEYIFDKDNSNLESNVITDIHCDRDGRIWIGTFYGGLSCIEDGKIRTMRFGVGDSFLSSDNIWSIDQDAEGRIWIGTLGGGVQSFDPQTGEYHTYSSFTCGLSNDVIHDLECADDGKVYVATAYGLSIIDPLTSHVKVYHSDDLIRKGITGVMVDRKGLVWLDEDGILQIYDPLKNVSYTPQHPALKTVRSIIKGKGNVNWVITDSNICRINVYNSSKGGYGFEVVSFTFPQSDNLHFNQRSVSCLDDGDFIIGSFNGYMRFRQEQLADERFSTDVNIQLTDLHLGNLVAEPGQEYHGRIVLDKAIGYTDSFEIPHYISIISIDFSCLDYFSIVDRPLYYRMEGLYDEWITTDSRAGRITFTNLLPGRYRLCVTSDISDLSKSKTIDIKVLPPWWFSWWAFCLYALILFSAVIIVKTIYSNRKRENEERLQQSIEQERRHYVDEMKIQFFTNVSHDFRTPLTLILTPIEDMLAKNPEKKNDPVIMTIRRNAQRLMNLVDEVLDLRKIEMYGMHLNLTSNDIVKVVNETVDSFRLIAESQKIEIKVNSIADNIIFDFDLVKVGKVLTNLLSNSFKFTPSGGWVQVDILQDDSASVRIEVKDTGIGIPDKEKKRIFDRFYQPKNSSAGSGIGLHVVKEYVLLHGGDVEVRDNSPSGCVFSFTLPIGLSCGVADSVLGDYKGHMEGDALTEDSSSNILIVDDNDDFRTFMCASLSDRYKVYSAADGKEALKLVEMNDIDVVICDVMMPVMDGEEFCRKMKSDINTSHIPVILLTAKSMPEDEYSGLESGADDYLTKPFNMSILRLRIDKFIEWKKRTKRMFEKELDVMTQQITITTMDDRLLQQAINVINENIGNPEFSVEELAASLCMHRSSLYKKLLYITGKTPVEFIRSIRLKKAASLLETEGVYVSEIAYMVGFNSPKVFAGHFKDEFGCSPTEYKKRINNQNK